MTMKALSAILIIVYLLLPLISQASTCGPAIAPLSVDYILAESPEIAAMAEDTRSDQSGCCDEHCPPRVVITQSLVAPSPLRQTANLYPHFVPRDIFVPPRLDA